jgi:hypothetical protein
VISAEATIPEGGTPVDLGRTVLIQLELGNAWGGKTRRLFNVGNGLSADMRLGNFEVVNVKSLATLGTTLEAQGFPSVGIPPGVTVYFSWTWELAGWWSGLRLFQNVPAGTILPVPEGAEMVMPEAACTITWQAPQYGTTFVQGVPAGAPSPVGFASAFSCNIPNKFVWHLRGL